MMLIRKSTVTVKAALTGLAKIYNFIAATAHLSLLMAIFVFEEKHGWEAE
jgi:hypothetical protein